MSSQGEVVLTVLLSLICQVKLICTCGFCAWGIDDLEGLFNVLVLTDVSGATILL